MKTNLLKISLIAAVIFTVSSCGPSQVIVSSRPEPPVVVRPAPPAPSYVWVDGEWVWRNGGYVYKQGYWAAPRYNTVWVGGHWQPRKHGWYWVPGHWR